MPILNIYLLRDQIKRADDAIGRQGKHYPIEDGLSKLGDLYTAPKPAKSPKWADLFADYVDRDDLGKTQSTGALYITKTDGRFFAMTFGNGRFILDQESIEERFGLKVTLNSLEVDALRSVDKKTFDAVDQISRVQVGQTSAAPEFGIDIDRDLIKSIVGYPADAENIGRRLSGADSLSISIDVDLKGLRSLLRRYLKAYQSDAYKEHFSWIDQIRQVRQSGHDEERLNGLLLQKLEEARQADGRVDGCWMAVPDVLEWASVAGFRFTGNPKDEMATDLHLPGFLGTVKGVDALTIELLKQRRAYALNDDYGELQHWSVYKCLHCELTDAGRSYLLSGGQWFEINKDFVKEVGDFYDAIPVYDQPLLVYNHDKEADYNKALVASDKAKWALMDLKSIKVGGIYDKVEFCDVYGKDGEMLHVKRYGGSNLLGHLFNQGLVSGELLRAHDKYVGLVNKKLPASHQIQDGQELPRDVSGYKVIFAIISQSEEQDLHIPFFARVALRNVHKQLTSLGYKHIMLAKIDSDPSLKTKINVKKGKEKKLV